MPNGFSMLDEINRQKSEKAMKKYYKTKNLKYKEEARKYKSLIKDKHSEDGESNYSGTDSGWGFNN